MTNIYNQTHQQMNTSTIKKSLRFLVPVILLGLFSLTSSAQLSTKYTFATLARTSFAAISGGTSLGSVASDVVATNIPIGFTFTFNCQNYTTVGVSPNGFLWFGSGTCSGTNYTPLSSTTGEVGAVDGIVTAFAKDLTSATSWKYITSGSSPNRTFTVEWIQAAPTTGGLNIQIILFETSNKIRYNLQDQTFLISGAATTGQTGGIRSNVTTDFMNRKPVTSGGSWCTSAPVGTLNTDVGTITASSSCTGYVGWCNWEYTYNGASCCTPPGTNASSFSSTSINAGAGSATVSFTRGATGGGGASAGVIVIARQGAAPTAPANGTVYSGASTVFGSGTSVGSGSLVYASTTPGDGVTSIPINLTNLTSGQQYFFSVYEYSTTGSAACYVTTPLSGSFCIGAPAAATVTPSSQNICSSATGSVSLTGLSSGGLYTYQWQNASTTAAAGGTYGNSSGTSTNATYTTPTGSSLPSNPVYYIAQVSCTNSSGTLTTQTSNEASASLNSFLNCYCQYGSFSTPTSALTLSNVNLVGSTITLNVTPPLATYTLTTSPVPDLSLSTAYTLKVTTGTSTRRHNMNAWADWDQSGTFGNNANEFLGGQVGPTSAGNGVQYSWAFTVPGGAATGTTALRVDYDNSATTTGFATAAAGSPGSNSACTFTATNGMTLDYRVQVSAAPCSGTPTAGNVYTGSSGTNLTSSVCPNATQAMYVTGHTTGVSGITLQWQVSTDNVSYANVSGGTGATSANFTSAALVNATLSPIHYYFKCVITCTNGGGNSIQTTPVDVTVNPTPSLTITPASASICAAGSPSNQGLSVSNAASGSTTYTWSPTSGLSPNTGASVTATPSVSTTYTVTGTASSCSSTKTVAITVNPGLITFSPTSPYATLGNTVAVTASATSTNGSVTYAWSPSTGLDVTTGATVNATPLSTTTYTVTASDPGGCSRISTVTVIINSGTPASVACGYSWSRTSNSWAALSGATVLASGTGIDNVLYTNRSIGFTFDYNGVGYTTLGVSSNGFIWFGGTDPATTEYNPISTSTALEGAISVFGADMASRAAGSALSTKVSGSSPNRTFTIEWNNWKSNAGGSRGDYQIILFENGYSIELRYNHAGYGIGDVYTGQVGLRGPSNTDFNNRYISTGTCSNWDSGNSLYQYESLAGTSNTQTMGIDGATYTCPCDAYWSNACNWYPSFNVTYKWTPTLTSPTVSPSAQQNVCLGNTQVLTASTSNPSPTYQWYLNGSTISGETNTTYSAIPGATGNYFYKAKITTGSCYRYTYVTPIVGISCAPIAYNVRYNGTTSANPSATVCASAITSIGLANAEADVTYHLLQGSTDVAQNTPSSAGAFDFSYSPTAGNTYTVVGVNASMVSTNMNGQVTINPNPANATGLTDQVRCGNGSVTFTVNDPGDGYRVLWSANGTASNAFGDGGTGNLTINRSPTVGSPVDEYALIQDRNFSTNCLSSTWVHATGTANAIPADPSGLSDQTVCANPTGNATFSVTDPGAGFTVQWSTTGSSNDDGTGVSKIKSVTVGSPITEYARIIDDATLCNSSWVSATGTAFTQPSLTSISDQVVCSGATINLHSLDPVDANGTTGTSANYVWSLTQGGVPLGSTTVNPTSNITYWVRYTKSACFDDASVNVVVLGSVTWDGSANDNDWFNPANWTPAYVPLSCTNVTIPSAANYPNVIGAGLAECNDLTVNATAQLNVDATYIANELEVNGDLVANGTINTHGQLINLRSTGGGISGTGNLTNAGLSIHRTPGSANYYLSNTSVNYYIGNLVIPTGHTLNVNDRALKVNAITQIGTIQLFNGTLTIEDLNATLTNATFDEGTSTTIFDAGNGQVVPSIGYNHLTITVPSGTTTLGTGGNASCNNLLMQGASGSAINTSLTGSTSVSGNFTITGNVAVTLGQAIVGSGGTFSMTSNNSLTITKDDSNTPVGAAISGFGALSFTNTVTYSSNSDQTLMGGTYSSISISGGTGTRNNNGDITVNNLISVSTGNVNTGAYKIVLTNTASTAISESSSAFVIGTVETTRGMNRNTLQDFGGIGIEITEGATAPATANSTFVRRVTGTEIPIGCANSSMLKYFFVTPATNTNLGASVVLRYFDSPYELNGFVENYFIGYKSTDNGLSWNSQTGTVDVVNNKITMNSQAILGGYTATAPFPLGGTVTPGSTIVCPSAPNNSVTLTVTGAKGRVFEWQQSTNQNTWTTAPGISNTLSYIATPSASTMYYRFLSHAVECWDVASNTARVDKSPTVPIVLTVTARTANSLTLNWGPGGSGNYDITYAGTGISTTVVSAVTPPKTITGLVGNGTYSITVTQTGVNLGTCPASGTISGQTTTCASPTNVSGVSGPTNRTLDISWTGTPGAAYRVYFRALFNELTYKFRDATISGANATLSVGVVNPNTNYEVYVAAKDCPSPGTFGQGSSLIYVRTGGTPSSCAPDAVIDFARSTCPVQLEVAMHNSPTNQYSVFIQRLTPTIGAVSGYTVTGGYFQINVGSSGQTYLVAVSSKCATSNSYLTIYGTVTLKPLCDSIRNLVLSTPTCKGFMASWNRDICLENTVNNYGFYVRKQGTLGFSAYAVAPPIAPISPYYKVGFYSPGTIAEAYTRSIYQCSGYTTTGPPSTLETISTLTAGCRDEEGDLLEPIEPTTQITSADNSEMIALYPNPTSGQFNLDVSRLSSEEAEMRIEVMNTVGQTVLTRISSVNHGFGNEIITMPGSSAAGTYFVRVTIGENVYTTKVNITK